MPFAVDMFFTLRSGGMEQQTALGWSSLVLAGAGPREGPACSHYSWNRSRVNTSPAAIGHCADLQQETEQGWGRGTGVARKQR